LRAGSCRWAASRSRRRARALCGRPPRLLHPRASVPRTHLRARLRLRARRAGPAVRAGCVAFADARILPDSCGGCGPAGAGRADHGACAADGGALLPGRQAHQGNARPHARLRRSKWPDSHPKRSLHKALLFALCPGSGSGRRACWAVSRAWLLSPAELTSRGDPLRLRLAPVEHPCSSGSQWLQHALRMHTTCVARQHLRNFRVQHSQCGSF